MKRSIHITTALFCVLLLMKPFDCFSSGQLTRKAVDCCKRGKCVPSSNADDCCKGTVPGGKQLTASKALHYSSTALDLIHTAPVPVVPAIASIAFADVEASPGSPPSPRRNLPLLI